MMGDMGGFVFPYDWKSGKLLHKIIAKGERGGGGGSRCKLRSFTFYLASYIGEGDMNPIVSIKKGGRYISGGAEFIHYRSFLWRNR